MADPDLGWTDLGVRPDASGFGRDLDRQLGPQMTTVGRSAASRFSAGFKRAATVGAAGAGFLAFQVGKDSISQASDLNESLNAVNVTYRKQADEVKKLGERAAESLGLSNTEFNGLSVQFSGFVDQIAGGDGQKVVGTLDDLTTRAADFASVMNLDVADSARLFQSGLAGETEPLRKFGIDLSAAAVEAFALSEGIQKQGTEFTESEKVRARYKLLMEQTSDAQGDFANTSESMANQQRILNARWDDAKAKLGTALLPIVEDFTKYLVDEGVPAVEKFAGWFTDKAVPAIGDLYDEVKPAAGAVKDLAGFLTDLPSEAKLAGVIALVGGLGAAKLRGGSGLAGSIGSAIGVMKPVPVLVTNPGFGGVGGGIGGAAAKGGRLAGAAKTAGTYAGPLAALGYSLYNVDKQLDNAVARNPGAKPSDFGYLNDGYVQMSSAAADARKEADRLFSSFGTILRGAAQSAEDIVDAYGILPKKLTTAIVTDGVPESKRAVRELLAQYDLTPRQKRTAFEILGYDLVLDRADRINRAYDHAARDRRMRISVEYEAAGYETRGGLQRGGGTTTTQTGRSRAGGGLG